MTREIFENAKFGDMFLTAGLKQAVFLRLSDGPIRHGIDVTKLQESAKALVEAVGRYVTPKKGEFCHSS